MHSQLPHPLRAACCPHAVPGFAETVRKYITHVTCITFQHVTKTVLGSALQLDGAALDALVRAVRPVGGFWVPEAMVFVIQFGIAGSYSAFVCCTLRAGWSGPSATAQHPASWPQRSSCTDGCTENHACTAPSCHRFVSKPHNTHVGTCCPAPQIQKNSKEAGWSVSGEVVALPRNELNSAPVVVKRTQV